MNKGGDVDSSVDLRPFEYTNLSLLYVFATETGLTRLASSPLLSTFSVLSEKPSMKYYLLFTNFYGAAFVILTGLFFG